ncbi:MAG: hypothetical protein PVH42_15805 [Desulfobacterales bacterium]|jgi:hypothetical protein
MDFIYAPSFFRQKISYRQQSWRNEDGLVKTPVRPLFGALIFDHFQTNFFIGITFNTLNCSFIPVSDCLITTSLKSRCRERPF